MIKLKRVESGLYVYEFLGLFLYVERSKGCWILRNAKGKIYAEEKSKKSMIKLLEGYEDKKIRERICVKERTDVFLKKKLQILKSC